MKSTEVQTLGVMAAVYKDHSKLSPLKNNFETQSTILIVFANVQEVDIARAARMLP